MHALRRQGSQEGPPLYAFNSSSAMPAEHPSHLNPGLPVQAYLASESEDSGEDGGAGPEEDDEEIRQRYRMLLAEGPGIAAQERHGKKDWGAGVAEEGSEDGSGSDGDAHQEADATRVQGDQGEPAPAGPSAPPMTCPVSVLCASLHFLPLAHKAAFPCGLRARGPFLPPAFTLVAGMEMEVTFLPGLENLGERLLARKRDEEARKGETVWEAYMRRKR